MAASSAIALSVAKCVEHEHDSESRFFEMQLALEELETGERLITLGGVWDKRERRYVGNASQGEKVVQVQPAQLEAAQWLCEWFCRYAEYQERKAENPAEADEAWVTSALLMRDESSRQSYQTSRTWPLIRWHLVMCCQHVSITDDITSLVPGFGYAAAGMAGARPDVACAAANTARGWTNGLRILRDTILDDKWGIVRPKIQMLVLEARRGGW